jgi:hypothetical protein
LAKVIAIPLTVTVVQCPARSAASASGRFSFAARELHAERIGISNLQRPVPDVNTQADSPASTHES